MKTKASLAVAGLAALLGLPSVAGAVSWQNKNVAGLQSTYDGADCVYFTLEGVAEADPVKPGDPWFAIPRSQFGAKDAYAMLLAAKLTGQAVRVDTRAGQLSCGYASVYQLLMD